MRKLNEFCHNHHPSGMKMLAKFIRRGFSDVYWRGHHPGYHRPGSQPGSARLDQHAPDCQNVRYAAYGLQGIGPATRAAVPVLMQHLNAKDSTTNGIMLVKDCIEELKAITLEDFGSDIQKWNTWWALNKATW
jgi:hypothetical protein